MAASSHEATRSYDAVDATLRPTPQSRHGQQADSTTGTLEFIGTATVLLRYAGFTILTDPNFLRQGERVSLGYGLHATRQTEPAYSLDALPPLDLVVLSHLHEDHFDRKVQLRLNKALPIVTTPEAAATLRRGGFRGARGLGTWQSILFVKGNAEAGADDTRLRITALPCTHGPGVLAAALPAVMGSLLDFIGPDGRLRYRIYITGDTLLYDFLAQIPRRCPDIDLMLLHLGGARVLGLPLTMNAQQGVEAVRLIAPRTAIPIHYDDYDIFRSHLGDFAGAVNAAGLDHSVTYLWRGETNSFAPRVT
jgi:L-ascorbate metabolism protein UlaG (beta-lactamase superfamily)